jgi:2-polyprenyl-3-methyl-5-hydroxy-6-metoxy-1,4-benzoquinol methylase
MSTTQTLDQTAVQQASGPGGESDAASGLDLTRVEAFAGTVLGRIADSATTLGVSIGHRTGLFDVLADLPPATSAQIAASAGLHERYVREWLAAMLVAGIVEHDPAPGTWWLPVEHAAVLTRAAGKDNLAKMAQLIGLLAGVEQQVVACFREGGGVPYSAYAEFHALMAEDSKDMAEQLLVDHVVPLVDGLAARLTGGIAVADVGCGSGHHLNVLAAAYPESTFVGYDFSQEAIDHARAEARLRDLGNVRFELRDVEDLSDVGPFDLVTAFDAIHDQAQPAAVLAGIAEALAPHGVFLMVDIRASSKPHENVGLPAAGFLYGISLMHCMTVSLAEGGVGLGTAWGEQRAVQMLREAGFGEVEVKALEGDFVNSYYVARRG